jgi:predicted MFS family arabinose efflux permease
VNGSPQSGSVPALPLSGAYRWYALGLMAAVYMCNLFDRWLMMLLLQPIKEDLHLSDTQLGFLTGIAFALFYAAVGVPVARWADRGNRVTISSLAIGLWGLTVMACLFVTSFAQLALARIAAAVGESGWWMAASDSPVESISPTFGSPSRKAARTGATT